MKQTPKERFVAKVEKRGDCWQWLGSRMGKKQLYPCFSLNGQNRPAHRVSYQLFKGEIPEGLTIDHLCGNTLCVNPGHLEAVTMKENILRGNGAAAKNARKTHCKRGHPYSGENLLISGKKRKQRYCRECRRIEREGS